MKVDGVNEFQSQYPEETRMTLNASLDGIYFATSMGHYALGDYLRYKELPIEQSVKS